MTDLATSHESTAKEMQRRARARLERMNSEIVRLSRANARLAEVKQTWDCTGELDIGAILIHTSVRIDDMRFTDGSVLAYDGTGWGVGLGASGKSIGGGIFNVSPSSLLNKKKILMQVFFLAVGLGGVEVTFWDEDEYLGIFAAGSIGAGAGSFAGDGKFEKG